MKSLINKFLLFAAVGSFVLLYSCGEDEPETPTADAPSISYTVTGGTANAESDTVTTSVGSTITWNFTITAPGGFNTFRIPEASFEQTRDDLGLDAGATSATINGVETPADQAGFATITLTAVDDLNQVTEFEVVIEITGTPAKVYTAVLLAPPYQDGDLEDSETFFASTTGVTYSKDEVEGTAESVSPLLDFGYYWGTSNGPSIVSMHAFSARVPAYDLSNFNTLNTTTFKQTTISAADFAELETEEQVAAAYAAGTDPATAADGFINQLEVGDVFAFQTDATKEGGSKIGLALVTDQVGEAGRDDSITLEILVQN